MRMILIAVAATFPAISALADEPNVGKREFTSRCASCHGVNGKGNGPVAELLSVGLPDLTQLTKNNEGEFPYDHIYRVIDGRTTLGSHGTRDMPIWGNEYNEDAVAFYNDVIGSVNSEIYVAGRILSLTKHLQSLQEK